MKKSNIFYMLLCIMIAVTISSCQGGNNTTLTNNNDSDHIPSVVEATQLSVDDMSPIPVVNGNNTQGKIYLRNDSNRDITDVSISLTQTSNSAPLGQNNFKILNTNSCTTVQANNFCALEVLTPSLKPGTSGNATVKISFTDNNGEVKNYNKIVNYRYVDTTSTTGVNFSDGSVNAIGVQGTTRHVVSYLVGGGAPGTIYNNVKLRVSKSGEVAIANGFINGTQVAATQVIPVEFLVNINGSVKTSVAVTPIEEGNIGTQNSRSYNSNSLQNGEPFGTSLTVNLTPGQNIPNLVFGNLAVLNMGESTESSITITVTNNGNADTQGPIVTNSNPGAVTVTNTCINKTLMANANNTCSITYAVNSTTSGNATLTYKSSDGSTTLGGDSLYWFQKGLAPALSISPSASNFTIAINGNKVLTYTLTNIGNVALNNIALSYRTSGMGSFTQTATTCSNGPMILNAGSSCTVTGTFTAGSSPILNATMYMSATGSFNNTNYNYSSLPTIFSLTSSPILSFTQPGAGVVTQLSTMANGSDSTQQVFIIQNTGNTTANISGYNLQNVLSATTNQPQIDNSIVTATTPCSANGTTATSLAVGASCGIGVKYGPISANNAANESGTMKLVINYSGGTPNNAESLQYNSINYNLTGNDSNVTLAAPAIAGLTGNGTQATPYQGTGYSSGESITLTYTNPSQNYSLTNLNFNTNNLPQGMVVGSGSTCPTGNATMNLAKAASCKLVLSLDKNALSKMGGTVTLNSNQLISYPTATWTTPMGFYSSTALDANGNSGFYLNYVQASITPNFSVTSGDYSTTTLTLTATNVTGYGTLTLNTNALSGWLDVLPSSTGCTINSTDYSASCNLVANPAASIVYTMPTYLLSGDSLNIPFMYSIASGKFVYLSPAYQVISYTKS